MKEIRKSEAASLAEPGTNPRSAPLAPLPGLTGLTGVAETLRASQEHERPGTFEDAGYTPPLSMLERVSTARLLPARYSDSVLTRIADSPADLQAVYALDNATNQRLLAEANRQPGIGARELLQHGRYARIVNAAFTHPHPLGARFSTPYRGAWYAGLELATAKAEVLFHRAVHLTEIGWNRPEALDYDHYSAEFSGPFHDLRQEPKDDGPEAQSRRACLDPASYIHSQALAIVLLQQGSLGVVYPSARRPFGTCLVGFQPKTVSHVHKREMHRLTWYPDAPPTFPRVSRTPD
jgi:hypothetical protein